MVLSWFWSWPPLLWSYFCAFVVLLYVSVPPWKNALQICFLLFRFSSLGIFVLSCDCLAFSVSALSWHFPPLPLRLNALQSPCLVLRLSCLVFPVCTPRGEPPTPSPNLILPIPAGLDTPRAAHVVPDCKVQKVPAFLSSHLCLLLWLSLSLPCFVVVFCLVVVISLSSSLCSSFSSPLSLSLPCLVLLLAAVSLRLCLCLFLFLSLHLCLYLIG